MKQTLLLLAMMVGTAVVHAPAQTPTRFDPRKNLVFNPSFDDTKEPLHGWMID